MKRIVAVAAACAVLEVIDRYPVTDATVLPDEPGWIPSDNGRIVP